MNKRKGTRVVFDFPQEAFGLAFMDANREKVVNADYETLQRAARTRHLWIAKQGD